MHRTHLCIVCAALASLIALLLMLAPSPATAQDPSTESEQVELPTTVKIGEGEKAKVVLATLKMLGTERPVPDFKLLVLHQSEDGSNHNISCITDADGKLRIELFTMPKHLRVYAYGDYVIPEGWSNIPLTTLKFEREEHWALQVRPLKRIKVHGRVTLAGSENGLERASVAFAPLDVAQDGSFRLFDDPRTAHTEEDGSYELELATGYYQVWSYWVDRDRDDWPGYIKVQEKIGIFEASELNLQLDLAPTIRGRVIDGRTGEGVPASINLYTNQYLRQLRKFTADGRMADEYDKDGKEVFWPVGTFRMQAFMVNPDDFTVVIKPAGNDQVMRVIPNLKLSEVVGREVVWELYTDDMPAVDVKVVTHKKPLPVNGLDINLVPVAIDVPEHLAQSYTAAGFTNDNGVVRFMGLASGEYEVYGARGSALMGKIKLTGEPAQECVLEYEIPFVTGKVKLENGEICTNLVLFQWITNQVGQKFGPYSQDAFMANPILQKDGTFFVPLLQKGSEFRLRFAAMEGGKAFEDADWTRITDFPLATEELTFKVEGETVWERELTLKPNPDYKPQPEDD